MMQPFTVVSGPAAPLMLPSVDTDVIIRIEHLTDTPKHELGRYAFQALRYRRDGSDDPEFILNRAHFRSAPILIAGPNFGCGSSREHAVWALQGLGIRCVIAPSFGDIFYANCFQNGILPVRLPSVVVDGLAQQCLDGSALTVDLADYLITAPDGHAIPFAVDTRRREMMLLGLDEIGLTLRAMGEIDEWQAKDKFRRPWAWPGVTA
jgi:3-isopropylmalate/(R)-2-methylmalate dehydratase small subunit